MSAWKNRGGKWLGAARSWMQRHTLNGDRVTWGSADELRPPLTVALVEDLATEVAEAVAGELVACERQVATLRSKLLMAEAEREALIGRLELLGETWMRWNKEKT